MMEVSSHTESIKLSIREPNAIANRHVMKNISTETLTYDDLLEHVRNANKNCNHFLLTFRGRQLKKNVPLRDQGIKDGCLVQVMCGQMSDTTEPKVAEKERFTEITVQTIVIKFRSVSAANFHKVGFNLAEAVFKKFPQLRKNLTAAAYLHDRTLLASLGNPEVVRKLAENNKDFLDAADFIVDYLRLSDLKVKVEPNVDEMDSSDSSDSPSTSSPGTSQVRRITSNQLAQALGLVLAGSNSTNSLANISQRNLNTQNSTESTPSAPTSVPTNSNSQRITSSMFMNALSDVLRSTRNVNEDRARQSENAPPAAAAAAPVVAETPATPLYLEELRQMTEMGLTDNEINMQALLLTNGDLEGAINIVLSGGMN